MTFRAERLEVPPDVARNWIILGVWQENDTLYVRAMPRVPFRCALSDEERVSFLAGPACVASSIGTQAIIVRVVVPVVVPDPTPGHGVHRG